MKITVLEAIQEVKRQVESITLPVREAENRGRLLNALTLLDALEAKIIEIEQANTKGDGDNDLAET